MKSLYFLLMAVVVMISSCAKDDSTPANSLDLKGNWELAARKGPYVNSTWEPVAADDQLLYAFSAGNRYRMINGDISIQEGNYKSSSEKNYLKVEALGDGNEVPNTWKIVVLGKDEIQLDDYYAWCGTGYTSLKLVRKKN